MHSKEWFSICAMVFVVLEASIFVFEDYSKHLFLELDAVSIKVYIMMLLKQIVIAIVKIPTILTFYEIKYLPFEKHPVVWHD